MPKPKDATDALESFGHNLGVTLWAYEKGILKQFFERHPYWLFREPPQYGRFNFIEKFEYLAVWWGNAVMIVSGFFLWATNLSFRLFPLWVYDIFKIIHSYMKPFWPFLPSSSGTYTTYISCRACSQ